MTLKNEALRIFLAVTALLMTAALANPSQDGINKQIQQKRSVAEKTEKVSKVKSIAVYKIRRSAQ